MDKGQRLLDLAIILPVLGFLLLGTPFLALFSGKQFLFGFPLLPLALFLIWFALIFLCWKLSRKLLKRDALWGRVFETDRLQNTEHNDEQVED